MDLFSGCWTIYTFSRLGANRGKRVRHLEPMKYRDCTKGKYQSSGNQLKKKSASAGQATQQPQWAIEETTWRLLLPLRELLSISLVSLDPQLLHWAPNTKCFVTNWSFLMALCISWFYACKGLNRWVWGLLSLLLLLLFYLVDFFVLFCFTVMMMKSKYHMNSPRAQTWI